MSNTQPFLFEIGTEELPPKSLHKLAVALEKELIAQLKKQKLIDNAADSRIYATPRRLAVFLDRVAIKQPDQVVDRRGPALKQAYDEQGQPTQAAIGFAKSVGFDVQQLQTQKSDKGEWLFCQVNQPGQAAQVLLPDCVDNALKALPIPKRMRWGNLEAEFIRPVKWVILLLGDEVIETQILSVKSDRFTQGHRFHAIRKLRLRNANEYESLLEQEGMVVADFARRRQEILTSITELAAEKDAQVLLDNALLDEVTGLVELPVALLGNIDQEFMQLPQEVLISSMQDHQKYFPLADQQGAMLPYFITVSNIRSKDDQSIIDGNERVLKARLSDANFFWETDRKTPLADYHPALCNVLFQEKLGSLADKVDRIKKIVVVLAQKLNVDTTEGCRAAQLCKLDLVTSMVGEFPELQGIMGKYYALNDGESETVANAIEQHYWPKFAGDKIPSIPAARVLAIADKVDTICGLFTIDQIPSGDRDPFALRRAGLGLMRILIEGQIDLDIPWVIAESLTNFDLDINANTGDEVYHFVFDRLRTYYQSQGIDTRVYQAVMQVKPESPLDFDKRLKAVAEFSQLESAESLIEANKRINNLLQKTANHSTGVDEKLLQQAQEKALFKQLQIVIKSTSSLLQENHYADLLNQLSSLKQPIDDFFDHVMVMDENMDKRQNRLAMLSNVQQLFRQVADVSYLK